jgi:hypothetical protein
LVHWKNKTHINRLHLRLIIGVAASLLPVNNLITRHAACRYGGRVNTCIKISILSMQGSFSASAAFPMRSTPIYFIFHFIIRLVIQERKSKYEQGNGSHNFFDFSRNVYLWLFTNIVGDVF